MAHSFVGYIDESGDDGIGNFRAPGAQGGQSRWLIIAALVFRTTNDLEAVRWRNEISALMLEKKRRDLHFAHMNHSQRIASITNIATRPIRVAAVLSNKTTIADGVYRNKNQLYFYLTRYLVERISWLCRDLRPQVPEGDGRIKLTFSRRGGMSYPDFKAYLERLKGDTDVKVHWPVIDIDGISAKDHSSSAALQLADQVTSAFASAVEPNQYGNSESRYVEILKPKIYNRNNNYFSYGVKIVPRHTEFELTDDQTRFIKLFE